jgi:50S ribosomal protein L16 3-hydroxylase
MKTLIELLGDLPLEVFLEKHFTRLPYSSSAGAKNFQKLLTWEVVEAIFKAGQSVLRVVKDGKVTKDYADDSFSEAKKLHDLGHTLLIRYAEKSSPELKALAHDFSGSFHTLVDIQLYCTPEGHNAFGWHYDVEEVFIIQAKGSKEYLIRPNTVHPHPLVSSIPKDLKYQEETSLEQLRVVLEEGDWLYIPSGWWHVARTQKESMHLSIGLMPNSAIDMVSHLSTYLARDLFWRARMPVHHKFESETQELEFYQEAMKKLGADLEKKFSDPEFLKSFLKNKKLSLKNS